MKPEVNHNIRKRFNEVIYHIARYGEILLSVGILIVIGMACVPLIYRITHMPVLDMDIEVFSQFLAEALSLVVGVEFVKMLCKHTAETLVEVLMFAIARQMVVEHLTTFETLIGVLAIALLFAVRKYLLLKKDGQGQDGDKL